MGAPHHQIGGLVVIASIRLAILAGLLLASITSPALAGAPTDALNGYVTRVLAVLDAPGMREPQQAEARHRAVRAIAEEGFDFQEASRRALGASWEARTPAERKRFVELFTALIDAAYFAKVAGYDGERMSYDGESVTGNEAVVTTRVIARDKGVTPVNFRLVKGPDGRWRVWDASFEGMSLLGNYRSQFARIVRTSSFQELVTRLEERVEALRRAQ
jgi:phospholipid transport system substrate-binding protein